jgi:curli biogenesis system outer membrane secretion channel CsgG
MRRFARLLVCVLAAAVLWIAPVVAQSSRPTVALMNFDFGSITDHWWGNQDIGAGIADMMVDSLVDDGSFRMIERKKLTAILSEQNFSNSERADPSAKAMAQIGKALGVKFLIVGSITKFGTEESKKGVGGGGFGSKFGIGSVGKSEGKANVAITARMVDTSTGEIMISAKGEGTSKRSGLMLGGAGGGGGKAGVGGINFSESNFKDTIIGEATEAAVKGVVMQLVAKKDRLNN